MISKNNPQSRQNDIVIQELNNELLIYDLITNQAYCLNSTAAFIWRHADGETPVSQIIHLLEKRFRARVDESIIWFTLEKLNKDGLMKSYAPPPMFVGLTRRQLIATIGKSAAVALPLITTIVAPRPASAGSVMAPPACINNFNLCNTGTDCCSGRCDTGLCLPSGVCTPVGGVCTSGFQCCVQVGCSGIPGRCLAPGGSCVLSDTPIMLADGREIKARDIHIGQELLGVNCLNGETIAGRVKHLVSRETVGIYSLVAENGDVVNCTASHDLIAGFGDLRGKRAELFKIGDPLLVFDRELKKIVEAKTFAIDYAEIPQPVIMFEMDGVEHTYVSSGIISHNADKA